MLTMNGHRPRFIGTVRIEDYDEQGNARVSCTCGARWWREKVRHKYATYTYRCPDCGAASPVTVEHTAQPRPARDHKKEEMPS